MDNLIRGVRLTATLAFIVLLTPAVARPQLAATVPSSDPIYRSIDRIAAVLPVKGLFTEQKPWSRREIARAALAFQKARAELVATGSAPDPYTSALVDSILATYATDISELNGMAAVPTTSGSLLRAAIVSATATNSAPRDVPRTNGFGTLGSIDAATNPLVEPNWGRPIEKGATGSLETVHEVGLGGFLALAAQPRVSWLQSSSGGHEQADLQRLYARGVVHNVAVEAGLDEYLWGQGGARGILLSGNPRPLHAISIANDTGITLPWILRLLGPGRAELLFANLGNTQNFPGAQLVTYGFSFTPTGRLELGAALLDQLGGGGSPACSVRCRLRDLFPYVMWVIEPGSDSQASNKIAMLNARYRFPGLRGLTVRYEMDMDDFDLRRVRSMLFQDTGHLLGASVAELWDGSPWSLDLEAHRTSLRLYEHPQYTSGVTYRRGIIGDPLGPNALALYATLARHSLVGEELDLTGAVESRDPSTYTVRQDANGSGFTFVKVTDGTKEVRERIGVALFRSLWAPGLSIAPELSVEHVQNPGFVSGEATNVLGDVQVRMSF